MAMNTTFPSAFNLRRMLPEEPSQPPAPRGSFGTRRPFGMRGFPVPMNLQMRQPPKLKFPTPGASPNPFKKGQF
jgi:hypothetical protein